MTLPWRKVDVKEDGGKLLDEGGLEAEDVEENGVNGVNTYM